MEAHIPRKIRSHYSQEMRRRTLAVIRDWIGDTPPEKVDRVALVRKIELVIGASHKKAREYVEAILGECVNEKNIV